MTLFYNKELRLLLKICILLLKASRDTISVKELDLISENNFAITLVSKKLLKNNLAVIIGTSIKLLYPMWVYEEMAHEIDTNKFVMKLRWNDENNKEGIWLPYYRQEEIRNEIVQNPNTYKGVSTSEDKIVYGISEKCIVLINNEGEKSYHWFILPKYIALNPKYKNTDGNGFELAKEILKLHGDWRNNHHLAYILFDLTEKEFSQILYIED